MLCDLHNRCHLPPTLPESPRLQKGLGILEVLFSRFRPLLELFRLSLFQSFRFRLEMAWNGLLTPLAEALF